MNEQIVAMREQAAGTLADTLGIRLEVAEIDRVEATMAVCRPVHQPFGVLHGGATVALAETVASIGAWLNVDPEREMAVGLEINANHIRSVSGGRVRAIATPVHLGRRTQVWSIEVRDDHDRCVAVSRCTLAVIPLPDGPNRSAS